MGRPTLLTPERWERILREQANGRFLSVISRDARAGGTPWGEEADPQFPEPQTIRLWVASDPALFSDLARARAMGVDSLLEEVPEIMDDGRNDFVMGKDGLMYNAEHVQRSRLRVEGRFKLAAILDPRRYGAKLELAGDPKNPVLPTDPRKLSRDELRAIVLRELQQGSRANLERGKPK